MSSFFLLFFLKERNWKFKKLGSIYFNYGGIGTLRYKQDKVNLTLDITFALDFSEYKLFGLKRFLKYLKKANCVKKNPYKQ